MLKCCQIICKVKNVKKAVENLKKVGFSVQWGSEPNKANNAFLWFEKGPFIEFFSMSSYWYYLSVPFGLIYGQAARKRLAYWSRHPEGWCDIALASTNELKEAINTNELTQIELTVNQAGISTSRIIHGHRVRPDGLKVKFSFMATEPVGLPFLVSTYDPPQRPKKIRHPNGARGVEWVKVAVASTHFEQFLTLTRGDKWIKPELASQTQVLEVGLAGLKNELDSKDLHGAVFTIASGD